MAWQKASGYHWRALVEAEISRFKRVIGDGRSRARFRVRSTWNTGGGYDPAPIGVAQARSPLPWTLNRMLELGRPEYVRTA